MNIFDWHFFSTVLFTNLFFTIVILLKPFIANSKICLFWLFLLYLCSIVIEQLAFINYIFSFMILYIFLVKKNKNRFSSFSMVILLFHIIGVSLFFSYEVNELLFYTNRLENFIIELAIFLLELLILYKTNKKYNLLNRFFEYKRKQILLPSLYFMFFFIFIAFHLINLNFFAPDYVNPVLDMFFYQMFNLCYVIVFIAYMKKEMTVIYYIKKYEHQKQIYKETEEFRHDYLNLLSTLKYLIKTKDWENSLRFLSDLENCSADLLQNDKKKQLELIFSPTIRGALDDFLKKAQKANLPVNFYLTELIPVPEKFVFDVMRILTIVLDNSIRHYSDNTRLNRPIQIKINKTNNYSFFQVINPCHTGFDPVIFFNNKKKQKGHLGLNNMAKICKQHDNILYQIEIDHSQSLFIFSLHIHY